MSKMNKILLVLVIVLLLVLAVIIYWQKVGFEKPYWAVFMNTGDLYFGKLNQFPKFSLSDVYFFQKTSDKDNSLSLSKFSGAFWGPEDKIYLNEKNIVWKAKLRADSQIVNNIKNPTAQQTQQPTPTQ